MKRYSVNLVKWQAYLAGEGPCPPVREIEDISVIQDYRNVEERKENKSMTPKAEEIKEAILRQGYYGREAMKLFELIGWENLDPERYYSLSELRNMVDDEALQNLENPGWVLKRGFYTSVESCKRTLDPGIYNLGLSQDGERLFSKVIAPSDEAVDLPGLPSKYIVDQIKMFWSKREVYRKYHLLQKRGILMYGEPGCGKTSIISLLTRQLIADGGIVFLIDDFNTASSCIRTFRSTEPDRPVMTLMEDFEGLVQGDQGNRQIKAALSLLDGQDQVDNIVHVATTNQPEALADRFIKRPGRFDLVIGIHPPKVETRRAYLSYICGGAIPADKLEELVVKTEGLSLAYLREIASTFLCLEIPIEETLERLKKNYKMKTLRNNSPAPLGFTLGYEDK